MNVKMDKPPKGTTNNADELDPLSFTDFDDSPTNSRPGLGYRQLYDALAKIGIDRPPGISRQRIHALGY